MFQLFSVQCVYAMVYFSGPTFLILAEISLDPPPQNIPWSVHQGAVRWRGLINDPPPETSVLESDRGQ